MSPIFASRIVFSESSVCLGSSSFRDFIFFRLMPELGSFLNGFFG
jgi:hypothetical protein